MFDPETGVFEGRNWIRFILDGRIRILFKSSRIRNTGDDSYLEKERQRTASFIKIKLSLAWYFRSLRILPVVKFQTWTEYYEAHHICVNCNYSAVQYMRACTQGFRIRVLTKSDPRLSTSNEGRSLKFYWIYILDNLKAFFSFS